MAKKYLRGFLFLAGTILAGVLAKQFCYKQTDGFAHYKILSSLSFNPDWEVNNAAEAEISAILDQPFRYLAKGAQSYVFASEDGQYVIKFFRIYHLQPPLWLRMLSLPPLLQTRQIKKMMEKREELNKDFTSYKIAFEEMREETGLLYLHLNKTTHLKKTLRIYDKIGIAYDLEMDQMEFLLQKRAKLVYPAIDALMKTQGLGAAKEAIGALVQLLLARFEKGIFDKDPDLNSNFGFLGVQPIQIDIGRFSKQKEDLTEGAYKEELLRITDNFRQWLDAHYPLLSEHLLSEIGKIAS
jgi:hypothetical protein